MKRLSVEKRVPTNELMAEIINLLENQFSSQNLSLFFEGATSPKYLSVNQKSFFFILYYIIETLLFDLKVENPLQIEIAKQLISNQKHLVISIQEIGGKPANIYSKLVESLKKITTAKVNNSFSFELANEIVKDLGGTLWVEHINEHTPKVIVALKG